MLEAEAPDTRAGDDLINRAAQLGFELVYDVTANGRSVWEWRRGDEPRPQFATERVARFWMAEWLVRAAEKSHSRG